MLNWLKNLYLTLKNFKFSVGDMGLNIKPEISTDIKAEIKVADKQTNKLFEVNQNDNSKKILQQNFAVAVLPNINVNEAIKIALSVGNENAKLIGDDVQKLLENSKISEEKIQKQLSNPEIISTIAKANEIAYKISDTDKRKMLSDLIYKKIKEDTNMGESNILSLAIKAMEDLTIDEVKITAFIYLFCSNYVKKNIQHDDFEIFYNCYIQKLIDISFENLDNIALNIIAKGIMVSLAVWATDIHTYLPSYFEIQNGKYHPGLSPKLRGYASHLLTVWNKLKMGSSFLTPQGKLIAKIYLSNTLGLYVEELKV